MTNKEIASVFNKLAKIMELHGENPFKTRSYSSIYNTIRKYDKDIVGLDREQLLAIGGIGKNIADKIIELKETGQLTALQGYLDITPEGIVELLDIKGLGAKKILQLWKELGVESPGELLYACEENRLIELKGYGLKSQQSLKEQLLYYLDSQGKYLYGHIEEEGLELLALLRATFGEDRTDFIGTFGRKMPIVEGIELVTEVPIEEIYEYISTLGEVEDRAEMLSYKGVLVIINAPLADYATSLWSGLASQEFLNTWDTHYPSIPIVYDQRQLFATASLPYIPPESRESSQIIEQAQQEGWCLITDQDIRGVIHTHTQYSDGSHSIREMADACIALGYEYLVITDHSQSAFYADGLKPNKVYQQLKEIEAINREYEGFKIFKGIESDILADGSLDYEEEILQLFDLVIASIHSNLKMDQTKAHTRLLRAIEHPATRILGHPTGRLLMSRPGYEIDHRLIIDACAKNDVVIELNANPYRLDVDWSWIPYAEEQGVLIAINPDAHSTAGIQDIRYGVIAARKGGMQPYQCLNVLTRPAFEDWIAKKQ